MSESFPLFVHHEIDDFGLASNEFRILAHIARRVGASFGGECNEAVENMAHLCKMEEKTARKCLQRLVLLGFLKKRERKGQTTIYTIRPSHCWLKECETTAEPYPNGTPTQTAPGVGPLGNLPTQTAPGHPTQTAPDEDTPLKDTPFEDTPSEGDCLALQFPDHLQGPEFQGKWLQWMQYFSGAKRIKKSQLQEVLQEQLNAKLAELTVADAVATIEHSIACGYKALYAPSKATRQERRMVTDAEHAKGF